MQLQTSKVRISGVDVQVRRGGKGPPVLFFHGTEGVPQWLPFFDAVSDGCELIVPDHPGFGESDDPALIRSVPDLAMFYLDFMEELGLKGLHVVGHSLGGWLAAEIAVRDRSRLKSLTLIAAAGIRIPNLPPADFFIWDPKEVVRNSYCNQTFAEKILAAKPTDEEREQILKNRFAAAKYCWQPRLFNPDLEKWLHRVKVPALILWGREDGIFPPEYADLWSKRLPNAEKTVFDNCGHLPLVEKSDEVAARIRQFWRTVST